MFAKICSKEDIVTKIRYFRHRADRKLSVNFKFFDQHSEEVASARVVPGLQIEGVQGLRSQHGQP